MKVHEFITSENWCQCALCRDKDGNAYHWPFGEGICQWCLTGMIIYCYPHVDTGNIFSRIQSKVGHIAKWNDAKGRSWEDVRALAIELDI